jgi:hypothetical protein
MGQLLRHDEQTLAIIHRLGYTIEEQAIHHAIIRAKTEMSQ